MNRSRLCLLLTALATATCNGGMIANPSANLETTNLQNGKGVDNNNGNDDGNGSVCNTPTTVGSISPNSVICADQNVTLRVAGAFTMPVDITIQATNGTSTTGTMNSCGPCQYTFEWNLPCNAPTGTYGITVTDSNAMTFTFDVEVKAAGTCGGDQDGDNGRGYGDGRGGDNDGGERGGYGGSTYGDHNGDNDDDHRGDGHHRGRGGDGDYGGHGGTTCGGSTTTTTTTGGGTTGTTTGVNPNTVTISG